MSIIKTKQTVTETVDVEETTEAASERAVKAVDIALGVPATVASNVAEAIEPWTDSTRREAELNSLRSRVEQGLKAAEKRGSEIRVQLTSQTRDRVEPVIAQAKTRRQQAADATIGQLENARRQLAGAETKVKERV